MHRVLFSALLLTLALSKGSLTAAGNSAPHTLRILTYNIHHGEGTDGQFDLPRIAALIASASPDLVALQEVDQGTQRASGVHQLTELERLTGLHGAFGKALEFQGGGYGVAVLSRFPILNTDSRALPGSPDREPRTELTVEVELEHDGPRLAFTTTHFDQGRDPVDRIAQAGFLNTVLALDEGPPSILAGDLNSRADAEVMQILAARWTDVSPPPLPVSASGRPEGRVDYVLARPASSWTAIDAQVIDDRLASDHRPVLVVLQSTPDQKRDERR